MELGSIVKSLATTQDGSVYYAVNAIERENLLSSTSVYGTQSEQFVDLLYLICLVICSEEALSGHCAPAGCRRRRTLGQAG